MPAGVQQVAGYVAIGVEGPLAPEVVGVLASMAQPLAEAGIPIVAIGTFDTDYVLVRAVDLDHALRTLRQAGHAIVPAGQAVPRSDVAVRAIARHTPSTFQGSDGIMRDDELELLQGTLDVLVLKTLSWGPRHGYAVARWIAETSGAELQIEEGALYTALIASRTRLGRGGVGPLENNRKAKFYQLRRADARSSACADGALDTVLGRGDGILGAGLTTAAISYQLSAIS